MAGRHPIHDMVERLVINQVQLSQALPLFFPVEGHLAGRVVYRSRTLIVMFVFDDIWQQSSCQWQ